MPAFLFRCPSTGLQVQGWVADDPSKADDDAFEAISCHACGQVHLVSPKSGKTLGNKSERLNPATRSSRLTV